MDLQYVDIGAQSAHAGIHRIENVLPGQPNTVDPVAVIPACSGDRRLLASVVYPEIALGQNDYAVPRDVVLCQGLSDDFLGTTMGVDVGLFPFEGDLRVSVNLFFSFFFSGFGCALRILRDVIGVELRTVSQVLIPRLYACSIKGRASSSFSTQSCHSLVP